MRKGSLTSIAVLSGALLIPAYADKVQIQQLPSQVQDKIRAQTGGSQIEDIDRDVRDGRTIYEVAFKRNGQNTELQFDQNSDLLSQSGSSTLDSRKISYSDLPVVVRRVADARMGNGAQVNDIDRQVKNGQVTYEIGYKVSDGPQHELVIADNGTVMSSTAAPVTPSTSTTSPTVSASSTTPAASSTTPANVRSMAYRDLPTNIRQIAAANLSHGDVKRVDRILENGEIRYEIFFLKENGQYQDFLVTENGQILRNQPVASTAVGASGTVQSGTASATSTGQAGTYSYVTSPVRLANSKAIQMGDLPAEVRSVARQQARNGNIEEILRGDWNGKAAYQVAFTDENKRYVELQLDDHGLVIYDPRTAGAPSPAANILNDLGRLIQNTQH